jgi:dipeptidase
MTVADVMAILRSTEGVEPLSTPRTQEGAVFQLRAELPPAIGCVYWRAVAEPATSVFTPWYAGITETPASYCRPVDVRVQLGPEYQFRPPAGTFDLDPQLAWWTFKGLQDAVHEDYPGRIKQVQAVWAEMEKRLFADQKAMEAKAASLWKTDPDAARALLTRHCADRGADACRQAQELAAGLRGVNRSTAVPQ